MVFIGVQNEHTIPSTAYHVMPTRSLYDTKLAKRASNTFAALARVDGTVESVDEFGIVVVGKDGKRRHVALGRSYGSSGGLHVPHDVVTNLKVGDKVKVGDAIAYNPAFFEPDPMNPKALVQKFGKLVKVALMEHRFTYEDSTAISREVAGEVKTKISKQIEQMVDFDQAIHRVVKVGQFVNVDDPLCYIEENVTADTEMFDEDSIDILGALSSLSPRTSVQGVVDKITVYYNGDKEDMSDSLRKLANMSDSVIVKELKAKGKKPYTGMDDGSLTFGGQPLPVDKAMIIFTITTENSLTSGDKLVYGSQLKCTIAHVFDEAPRIVNDDGSLGEKLGGVFSGKSVNARIVGSPYEMGMCNSLCLHIGKQGAETYFRIKNKGK